MEVETCDRTRKLILSDEAEEKGNMLLAWALRLDGIYPRSWRNSHLFSCQDWIEQRCQQIWEQELDWDKQWELENS